MTNQIGHSVSKLCPDPQIKQSRTASTETTRVLPTAQPPLPAFSAAQPTATTVGNQWRTEPTSMPHSGASSTLTPQDMNLPGIQRYVVEHIVKSDDSSAHHLSAQRLRSFSGRTPRPAHEVDYDTWRTGVELLLNDPAVSDLHRSRRIVDSLLPPAVDLVRHLSPDTLPPFLSPDVRVRVWYCLGWRGTLRKVYGHFPRCRRTAVSISTASPSRPEFCCKEGRSGRGRC